MFRKGLFWAQGRQTIPNAAKPGTHSLRPHLPSKQLGKVLRVKKKVRVKEDHKVRHLEDILWSTNPRMVGTGESRFPLPPSPSPLPLISALLFPSQPPTLQLPFSSLCLVCPPLPPTSPALRSSTAAPELTASPLQIHLKGRPPSSPKSWRRSSGSNLLRQWTWFRPLLHLWR